MQIKPFQADSFINTIAQNKEIFAALVYGPESGLVSIRSKKIATSIVADLSDAFLVVSLNEKQIDEDKGLLADEFAAISMLGGRKLIMVDGGNKVTESLKMIFEAPKKQSDFKITGDNFILISAGDLDKSSSLRKFAETSPYIASIACYEDDAATISGIIRQKFKEQNFTFEEEAVPLLIEKFGKNRQIILNEIDKLALFMGKEKHITTDILQDSIADLAEISAFQLVEEFANRDLKKSILLLEKLFAEKTSAITIIRFITNYFTKLSLAKNALENGSNLDLEMKIHNIFFKQQASFKKHLQMWSQQSINILFLKLQELEVKCKNSNFDSELLLSVFINFSLMKKSA
ncbi:MAG: polymerase delta subunit [Rickettsiaceae bacterium]|jgi:DNA polymerase-3 subunit delta|nr:polymerase delta subunit [Rickettsiaceae bacterium]